jgi:hypothetical protein
MVKRLLALIEDHRVSATRLRIALVVPTIDVVLCALEAETHRKDPTPILKHGEEVRSYGSHLLGRIYSIPSQKAHSMKVSRKPLSPFPDRLYSVFSALG